MTFVSRSASSGWSGEMPMAGVDRVSARRFLLACSLALVSALASIAAVPSIASAANNIGPSTAKAVKIGVPFTGAWAGTKSVSGRGYTHWWRLPGVMRPGDEAQVAVDNGGGVDFDLCLVSPVDDFDANVAVSGCGPPHIDTGVQTRSVLSYEGSTGQPFLVVREEDCCGSLEGAYTITVERIVTTVNVGMVVPRRLPASFSLTANLTYSDNTPAGDGIPAVLQWRFLPTSKSNPPSFADVATGFSAGGVVTFTATMPPEAQGGKVQLRACVAQPGGDSRRCGATASATVAVSVCSRALASRRAKTKVVRRLKRKLRRARAGGRVKPGLRLELKAKRVQLAQAKRSVKAHC